MRSKLWLLFNKGMIPDVSDIDEQLYLMLIVRVLKVEQIDCQRKSVERKGTPTE